MNHMLMVILPIEFHETFVKTLPPGSSLCFDQPVDGGVEYIRWFDSASSSWMEQDEYNQIFLRTQQNWANDMLRARGHVFLNEIFSTLGLSHTSGGALIGWALDQEENHPQIDFGCWGNQLSDPDHKGGVQLKFNTHGPIWHKLV